LFADSPEELILGSEVGTCAYNGFKRCRRDTDAPRVQTCQLGSVGPLDRTRLLSAASCLIWAVDARRMNITTQTGLVMSATRQFAATPTDGNPRTNSTRPGSVRRIFSRQPCALLLTPSAYSVRSSAYPNPSQTLVLSLSPCWGGPRAVPATCCMVPMPTKPRTELQPGRVTENPGVSLVPLVVPRPTTARCHCHARTVPERRDLALQRQRPERMLAPGCSESAAAAIQGATLCRLRANGVPLQRAPQHRARTPSLPQTHHSGS